MGIKLSRVYNKEKISFLKKHYKNTTLKELTQLFNEKFKLNKAVPTIKDVLRKYRILKDKKNRGKIIKKYHENKYTKEHADFIRKNYTENPKMMRKELIRLFNEKFGIDINWDQLSYVINKYKLIRDEKKGHLNYTHEVKQFMIKCIAERMTKQECKDALEKKFERNFNKSSIGIVANKMGLCFMFPMMIPELFKEREKEIEKLIRKIISKNKSNHHHGILIRDAIIEKYRQNLIVSDIRSFCRKKDIEINYIGKKEKTKKETKRERSIRQARMERRLDEELTPKNY